VNGRPTLAAALSSESDIAPVGESRGDAGTIARSVTPAAALNKPGLVMSFSRHHE
jgi:hypothetical protein